jgi:hypothetical protein
MNPPTASSYFTMLIKNVSWILLDFVALHPRRLNLNILPCPFFYEMPLRKTDGRSGWFFVELLFCESA